MSGREQKIKLHQTFILSSTCAHNNCLIYFSLTGLYYSVWKIIPTKEDAYITVIFMLVLAEEGARIPPPEGDKAISIIQPYSGTGALPGWGRGATSMWKHGCLRYQLKKKFSLAHGELFSISEPKSESDNVDCMCVLIV